MMNDSRFIKIYGWIFNRGMKPTETIVFAYIVSECEWHDGVCERPIVQIAEDLHLSKPTIINAVNSLVNYGLIYKDGEGHGRGNVTRYLLTDEKGKEILPFIDGNGKDLLPFTDGKGKEIENKRLKGFTFSPYNNRHIYRNKKSVENAHTREEELKGIITKYEKIDPNGLTIEHTEAETLRYKAAKEEMKEIIKGRAEAEWSEILEKYPTLKEWHGSNTGEDYVRLVNEYGEEAVMEAIKYTANRRDLQYEYHTPLGYVEFNIKNRNKYGHERRN